MGLDIRVMLLVGVPLLGLGRVESETEKFAKMDTVGRKVGGYLTMRRVYLETIKGRCLIGSNEKSLSDPWKQDRIEYDYCSLFGLDDMDDVYDIWIHECASESEPDDVVVGLEAGSVIGPRHDRWQTYQGASFSEIAETLAKVQGELRSRFGYEGEISVIAQAQYSY